MTGGTVQRAINAAPCRVKCAGGRPCCCNGRAHTQHICSDPDCLCHMPAAFGLELEQGPRGVLVYRPAREVTP